MKQYWQKLSLRIDAMTLRERAMIFAMVAVVLIALLNVALLDPAFSREKLLSQSIKQDQAQIAALQTEIQQKLKQHEFNPNTAHRARLQQLKQEVSQIEETLQGIQKGLVAPDQMAGLLESILKRHEKLHLVSLSTLPPTSLNDAGKAEKKADKPAETAASPPKADAAPPAGALYRHGVVIAIEGSYPDLMQYVATLEAMPWHLLWGKANLHVEEYPRSTLTLTLYTLSLDKKWLGI